MAASALVGPSTLAFARQSPRPLVSALCAASTSRSRPSKRRCFAVSASRSATELPSTVEVQQAIAKAKASDVVSASQTAQAERTMRRFWKQVGILDQPDGTRSITLDKRNLKTPSGLHLRLPPQKLAATLMIAHEWDAQDVVLKPHNLPVTIAGRYAARSPLTTRQTSLAARAMEGLSDPKIREEVVAGLHRYLDTDTVCFHEDEPESLVRLQEAHWLPLVAWVNERFGTDVQVFRDLLGNKQSQLTHDKLGAVLDAYDPWQLAAFERTVMTTKSFIIGIGMVEGRLTVDQAAQCAHVEVQSQIDRWGEVEDSHDVDHQDVRSRLGSVATVLIDSPVAK